jgi:DNA-binding transcriptional ArsR family regulator
MTPEDPFDNPEKLNVDKKKRFHLHLPEGKEQIIELTDKEIETIENWFPLLGKHKIRFEIETILQIFNELNITEISHMVEQSKSTVDRHLKSMEKDGLLVSRTGDPNDPGRIPPKLYQFNRKLYQILQYSGDVKPPIPTDPKKLIEYYQREIETFRAVIHRFITLLEKMNPLLNLFENQLSDVNLANQVFEDYFNPKTTINFPAFGYTYINEKYIGECFEANREFRKKLQEILTKQNADPEAKERSFVYFNVLLPIKALFDIYMKEILDKK